MVAYQTKILTWCKALVTFYIISQIPKQICIFWSTKKCTGFIYIFYWCCSQDLLIRDRDRDLTTWDRDKAETLGSETKTRPPRLRPWTSETEIETFNVNCVLKVHWTTLASSPNFFLSKESWDFYTIINVHLTVWLIIICNFNLITKICEFFLQPPLLKVCF